MTGVPTPGAIGGFSGRNSFGLRAEMLSRHWERGLEILSDCVLHPAFNEIDLENDHEIIHRDYVNGIESVAGRHKASRYSPVTTSEMAAGRTVVNNDSKADPRTAKLYKKTYGPAGERSYIAVPLMRDGRWLV